MPLIVTLAVRQRAMLNGDAVAERAAKQRGHGRRQGNFRHHEQHLTAALTYRVREAQVDLGLAAAGYSMKKRNAKAARFPERGELLERRLLLRSERASGIWRLVGHGRALERIALLGFRSQRDEPTRREPREDVSRDTTLA